jgi:LuxR family maltose regulon positive regulatory protein
MTDLSVHDRHLDGIRRRLPHVGGVCNCSVMGAESATGFSARPVLLAPKLRPPVPRDGYVRRDRLHDALSCASSTQVTLVSAPAGKTALVAAWLADLPTDRWAWLSLDSRDDDMVRVWSYLIEALRSLADGVGDVTLNELTRSGGRGAVDRWLGSLLNDLAAVDRPMSYLVVDDLQVIADAEIRASVTMFVANMPPWLRLIILTRAIRPCRCLDCAPRRPHANSG